jgi:hypothetical protein
VRSRIKYMLHADEMRSLLRYEPDDGIFVWRHNRKRARGIKINGRRYRPSHLAWLYMTGRWPKRFVLAIDGDNLNIRWDNLREASSAPNRLSRSNASGYRGVSAYGKKWRAQIMIDGKQKHLSDVHSKKLRLLTGAFR